MKKLLGKTSFTPGSKRVYFEDGILKIGTSLPSGVTLGYELPSERGTYYAESNKGAFVIDYELALRLLAFSSDEVEGMAILDRATGEIVDTVSDVYSWEDDAAGQTDSFGFLFESNTVSGNSDLVHYDSSGQEINRIPLAFNVQWSGGFEGNYFYGRTYGNDVFKIDVRDGTVEWSVPITDPQEVAKVGNYVYVIENSSRPRAITRLDEATGAVNAPASLPSFSGTPFLSVSNQNNGLDRLFIANNISVTEDEYFLIDSEGNEIASRLGINADTPGGVTVDSEGVYIFRDGIVQKLSLTDLTEEWSYTQDVDGLQYNYAYTEDVLYFGGNSVDVHAVDKRTGERIWHQEGLSLPPYSWNNNNDIYNIVLPPA